RQQVEPGLVHEDQHPALAPRPPAQLRPGLGAPAPDGPLVPLEGPPDRHLRRPAQLLEEFADVALVVAGAELLLEHLCDAGAGPDLTAEAIGLGPVPEELGDQGLLRSGELGRCPWAGASAQGLGPAFAGAGEPTADAHLGNAQGLGGVALGPAVLREGQGSKPPPFKAVSRKEVRDVHAAYCIPARV